MFGCYAYYYNTAQNKSKLDDRALKEIFVGYCLQTLGYRIYNPKKDVIVMTRHVKFDEDKCPRTSGVEYSELELPTDSDDESEQKVLTP